MGDLDILPAKKILEYKKLVRKHYGIELTDEDAFIEAHRTKELFMIAIRKNTIPDSLIAPYAL